MYKTNRLTNLLQMPDHKNIY